MEQLRPGLESEGVPILARCPGFRGFSLVREAEDRATVLLFWDSQEDAANGAKVFGPTWFAAHIAPHLASEQQRSGGEIIIQYPR